MGQCSTVAQVIMLIKSTFNIKDKYDEEDRERPTVSKDWIFFTSIHQAKGLECDRVWWVDYDKEPKRQQLSDQETNLKYVATTRSSDELHLVKSAKKKEEEEWE
jgi:superfamily I DNA/RNA helicase